MAKETTVWEDQNGEIWRSREAAEESDAHLSFEKMYDSEPLFSSHNSGHRVEPDVVTTWLSSATVRQFVRAYLAALDDG